MFLNGLKNSQKSLFMALAIKAAESNGVVPLEQKNMLKAFAIEMGITPVYHTAVSYTHLFSSIEEVYAITRRGASPFSQEAMISTRSERETWE